MNIQTKVSVEMIERCAFTVRLQSTMIILFITAMIAAVNGGPRRASSDCFQPIDRLPCNILYNVIEREGLFSFSKETLENDCPKILDSFNCLKDHWAKCNPFSVDNLVIYISGMKSIMEELCQPGSELRKEYEEHIPCLTASSKMLQNCTYVAERKVSSRLARGRQSYLLSVNTYRCLAHIELAVCARNVATEECGPEAGQLLGRLIERSVRPYRHVNCYQPELLTRPSKKEEYKRLLF